MKHEEEYVYTESQEISVGENPAWVKKIASAFPAFQSRNYQLYFYGQLLSLIGTWLQVVAEGWLVLQLTNSAFLLGVVAAIATFPSLLFSLFGGVIIDRFSKRNILIFTQSVAMTLAFILGSLTVLHIVTVWEIATLAFLLGSINAIDIPARQAFIVELVNKEQLTSAIALNSGVFNAARVVGPAVAGFLIALIGTGGAFILNGVSYIAVIVALLYIRTKSTIVTDHPRPLIAIKNGIVYSFSHPVIRILLIFVGVVSIFGWSFSTIMPLIAKNTFHTDASGLGYLNATSGLGALSATFLISAFSKKIRPIIFIIGGNSLFAISIILFAFIHSFVLAMPFLFLSGLGLLTQFATMNTTVQHMVNDTMRGRVMSIYVLMFFGLSPVGNFEVGFLAEHLGSSGAIALNASIVFLFGVFLFFIRNRIREAHTHYVSSS